VGFVTYESMYGFCKVWVCGVFNVCVCVGFVMCYCVYMGFIVCGCVYVWVL